jgi:hypothetical protein
MPSQNADPKQKAAFIVANQPRKSFSVSNKKTAKIE